MKQEKTHSNIAVLNINLSVVRYLTYKMLLLMKLFTPNMKTCDHHPMKI